MTESKENLSDDAPKPTSKLCKHVKPVKISLQIRLVAVRMAKVEFEKGFLFPKRCFVGLNLLLC